MEWGKELIKVLCLRCCCPLSLLSQWPPFVINPFKTGQFCFYATENHTLSLLYNFKARGLIHHTPLLQDFLGSSPTFNSWPSFFCLLGAEVTGLRNTPVTISPQQREGRTWVDKETWCVLVILFDRHCPCCLKPSETIVGFGFGSCEWREAQAGLMRGSTLSIYMFQCHWCLLWVCHNIRLRYWTSWGLLVK